MTRDLMETNWAQLRVHVREWWDKLTDQDLALIAGRRDALIATLQERYGWTKRDAENEVSRRFREITQAAGSGKRTSTP
jgi:uncharacterized protein YjbJ (UPF0337 family)